MLFGGDFRPKKAQTKWWSVANVSFRAGDGGASIILAGSTPSLAMRCSPTQKAGKFWMQRSPAAHSPGVLAFCPPCGTVYSHGRRNPSIFHPLPRTYWFWTRQSNSQAMTVFTNQWRRMFSGRLQIAFRAGQQRSNQIPHISFDVVPSSALHGVVVKLVPLATQTQRSSLPGRSCSQLVIWICA